MVDVFILSVDATPINAEPSNAGNAPVNCADGKEVKFAPEPLNDVAVATPLNLAPPSLYIVAPAPIGVSPPRTFTPATSTPALCKFDDPVLKFEKVATPTDNTSFKR